MKKQIMTYILIGVLFIPAIQIRAAEEHVPGIQLAQDVFIEGLTENTELYVGEAIHIRGFVDEQATQQDITWQVTGNNGIIAFDSSGNDASIVAKAPGTVWIMARATDGSDRAREYTVHIKPKPTEESNQGIEPPVEEEINPPSGEGVNPPVEEETNLPSGGGVKPPVEEEINPPSGGEVKPPVEEETNPPSGGEVKPPVEEEINPPSGGEVKPPVEEGTNLPSEEEVTLPNKEEMTEIPVIEEIIISGGTGGSLADPIIITLNKDLTSEQKIALMNHYLTELKVNHRLKFMSKRDNSQFTAYTLKVAEAKNDFFIEIRVEKEDQEAYIPIIEMLEDIEKESVQGINKDVVAQKDEAIKKHNDLKHPTNILQKIDDQTGSSEKVNNQIDTQREAERQMSISQEVEHRADRVEGASNQVELLPEVKDQTNTLQETAHETSASKEANIQVDTRQEVNGKAKESKRFKISSLFVILSLGAAFVVKNLF